MHSSTCHIRRLHGILLAFVILTAFVSTGLAANTYTIKKNDTLGSIAERHGVTASDIARYNNLSDPDKLRIGQKLLIPPLPGKFQEYTVRKGDVLSSIAEQFDVSVADITHANDLKSPDRLKVGQQLVIPLEGGRRSMGPSLPSSLKAKLDRIPVRQGRWRYIVIHHSGSKRGSVKGMDRYHREERHMENGLAYHFVIGNGRGMGDGELAMGDRWRRQINGGHLASEKLNSQSIGICLVGNFDKTSPSSAQMENLEALIRYLMMRCELSRSRVKTHTEINTKPTKCPGKHFPMKRLQAKLRG